MITPSLASSVPNNVTNHDTTLHHDQSQPSAAAASKKKRNLPGNPDPEAEVVALSPRSLMSTNRFVCEICNKGFQRDQNLQLHRRGHNLPWKLKQRAKQDVIKKKVYVCPEPACVHHDPSRALGDLTGIKKHFSRKHGEKKWKCEKCSKRYAVQSDWRAHSKICGTREYRCDCGTIFSRRDSFITHRAFCDALAEETARSSSHHLIINPPSNQHLHLQIPSIFPPKRQLILPQEQEQEHHHSHLIDVIDHINYDHHLRQHVGSFANISSSPTATTSSSSSSWLDHHQNPNPMYNPTSMLLLHNAINPSPSAHMSATALLQKAADQMGVTSMTTPRPGGGGGGDGGGHDLTIGTGSQSSTSMLAGLGTNLQAPHVASTSTATASTPPLLRHDHGGHHMVMGNSLSSAASVNYGLDQAAGSIFGDAFSNGTIFLGSKTSFQEAPQGLVIMDTSGTTTTRSRVIGQGNDEMTRDFLGLRGFNPSDPFLNMAGWDHITTPSPSTYHQHQNDHSQTSWQG